MNAIVSIDKSAILPLSNFIIYKSFYDHSSKLRITNSGLCSQKYSKRITSIKWYRIVRKVDSFTKYLLNLAIHNEIKRIKMCYSEDLAGFNNYISTPFKIVLLKYNFLSSAKYWRYRSFFLLFHFNLRTTRRYLLRYFLFVVPTYVIIFLLSTAFRF